LLSLTFAISLNEKKTVIDKDLTILYQNKENNVVACE